MSDVEFNLPEGNPWRQSRRAATGHPSPEHLADYRRGDLTESAKEGIRTHLVECQECSDLVLELAAFEDPETDEAEGPSRRELRRAWSVQRRQLFPRNKDAFWRWSGWVVAAGMAVVLAAVGLSLSQPLSVEQYLNAPRRIPAETSRRTAEGKPPLLEVKSGQPAMIVLLLDRELRFSTYRAELFYDRAEAPFLVREDLSSGEDLLLIGVPPRFVESGQLRVAVSGLGPQGWVPVENYVLQIQVL